VEDSDDSTENHVDRCGEENGCEEEAEGLDNVVTRAFHVTM